MFLLCNGEEENFQFVNICFTSSQPPRGVKRKQVSLTWLMGYKIIIQCAKFASNMSCMLKNCISRNFSLSSSPICSRLIDIGSTQNRTNKFLLQISFVNYYQ